MRSRWFHVPRLHTSLDKIDKKASWLELFYDLIFVAAFIQLGNGLSLHISFKGFAGFCALFVPLWIVWTGFTFFCNRFTVDDFLHRLLVFMQMFAVGAMAISAPRVLGGMPTGFAVSCAAAQALVAIIYFRAAFQVDTGREYSRYWGKVFGFSALLWTISIFVPTPGTYILWTVGVLVVVVTPFRKHSRELDFAYPLDREHLQERYGLLTMIVLGESFVKVLSELSGTGEAMAILQASMTLVITCSIWWIYFDDVADSEVTDNRFAPDVWLFAHLPLQLGVTASGVAIKKAVTFDLGLVAPPSYRWLICGTLALVFISTSIIDGVTERKEAEMSDRLRVNMRFGSGIALLLLAPAGAGMSAAWFIALVASLCIAQVIFDMMMAPLQQSEEQHETIADLVRSGDINSAKEKAQNFDVTDAIRKGTPSSMRRDIYFFLMEGTWKRFFLTITVIYLFINLVFAGLYMIEPGCIDGAKPGSFSSAFFFSVQTLSTIGYGAMSPATDWGNTIVTVEAGIGMLFVALITGMTFAKASRPKTSVLFSDNIVITTFNGLPTLMLRAGNARGNEIVDANVTVTVLRDLVSEEGHHLRKLIDLPMVRSRSPLFAMTWSIYHPITEDSPLSECDWHHPEESIAAVIVTLIGHDGTYGQTVYARKIYQPKAILANRKFVDVIGHMPDGRFLVDYHKFHQTLPETSNES